MKTILTAAFLALSTYAAFAQTPAIVRAEQAAAVAGCKLSWLKSGGRGSSSVAYFRHMAGCLG